MTRNDSHIYRDQKYSEILHISDLSGKEQITGLLYRMHLLIPEFNYFTLSRFWRNISKTI